MGQGSIFRLGNLSLRLKAPRRGGSRNRFYGAIVVAMRMGSRLVFGLVLFGGAVGCATSRAQQPSHPTSPTAAEAAAPTKADPSIHRLILKDGSYQVVNKWEIQHAPSGDRVRYISTERGGDWEELPIDLIDWAATRAYAKEHFGDAPPAENAGEQDAAAIDAEEKADRNRNPEVAPHLRLPEASGIWALDTFHDQPELVDLEQNTVNPRTGHNVVHSPLNPAGATRQTVELNERHAKPSLHESQPVFYVSVDTPGGEEPGSLAVTVDTHGGGSEKGPESASSPDSHYVILHADVRKDYRFVGQVKINAFGGGSADVNVFATKAELLPGKHWLKVTPKEPLGAGDYVLMEVLSPKEVNLAVWDFRIAPGAPDNENAIIPLQR
jgi:hypothetical protein